MFTITDTEINPVDVLAFKKVQIGAKFTPETGVCEIVQLQGSHSQADIESNYTAWKAEYTTAKENEVDDKASGNQKLLDLGLTQAEATALTGYKPTE
jgi:hypothetical protein